MSQLKISVNCDSDISSFAAFFPKVAAACNWPDGVHLWAKCGKNELARTCLSHADRTHARQRDALPQAKQKKRRSDGQTYISQHDQVSTQLYIFTANFSKIFQVHEMIQPITHIITTRGMHLRNSSNNTGEDNRDSGGGYACDASWQVPHCSACSRPTILGETGG